MLTKLLSIFVAVSMLSFAGIAQHALPAFHYKVRVIQQVYQQISHVLPTKEQVPKLRVYSRHHLIEADRLACYYPGYGLITIGEELYDLCTSLGADSLQALACVIGHELAHFAKHHNLGHGEVFGLNHPQPSTMPAVRLQLEKEADLMGISLARKAGFSVSSALPHLLHKIYAYYQLADQAPGYPSKAWRIAIALND